MTPYEYELVRQLVHAPSSVSRNRNAELFRDPVAVRARRTARLLRALMRNLRAVAPRTWSLERGEEAGARVVRLRIDDAEHGVLRRTVLTLDEFRILQEVVDGLELPGT